MRGWVLHLPILLICTCIYHPTPHPLVVTHPARPYSVLLSPFNIGALDPQLLVQRFTGWQRCSREPNHRSRESYHLSHSLNPRRSYDYPTPPASLSRSFLALLQLGSTLAQVSVSIRLKLLPTTHYFFLFPVRCILPYGASRFARFLG